MRKWVLIIEIKKKKKEVIKKNFFFWFLNYSLSHLYYKINKKKGKFKVKKNKI